MQLDTELGESAWPDEEGFAARIAENIRTSIVRRYPPERRPARRDAHPKAHGCVRAEVSVRADLPASFAHGVFVPGASYAAWVRFSNGSGNPKRPDFLGDARGMAIKLLGVPGEKLLPGERAATTQDFVLISHPTFFVDDPRCYARLVARSTSRNRLVAAMAPLVLGWKGLMITRRITAKQIASPLETRYWSTVPFALGVGPERRAVKFSARPSVAGTSTVPADPDPDYLRHAMIRTLDAADASFDLLVQPRAGPWMSVEDPRTEWTESEAPFEHVATLRIPRQVFATPERDAFGENLSFTPWHALPDHRPLGGVNRIRRVVYEAIATLRHELNGVERREP